MATNNINDTPIKQNEINQKEIDSDADADVAESAKIESITLELGDIIEIVAPSNPQINEITAIITYIDQNKIKLLNTATSKYYQLNVNSDGGFTDESITQIILLSRSDEPGFARQNNLLPKTWVDIHFGGEIPVIITGEITNLEEDMIELTTYPEIRTIYINFGYNGIPEDIPIDKIIIRKRPASLAQLGSLSLIRQQLEEGEEYEIPEENLASMEYTETGESILNIPEGAKPDVNIREALRDLYVDANTIIFGERLEPIVQLVEVPEGQQRYGLDVQVNDLMDELLSTIPNSQRTKKVLDNIHRLIERFKELRSQFSKFDANDNIYDVRLAGVNYKPIIDHIRKVDKNLRWLIPVVSNRRKIYDADTAIETADTIMDKMGSGLRRIELMQTNYYKKNDKTQSYVAMQDMIQEWWNPVDAQIDNIESCLTSTKVLTDLDTIVENLDDFYSSVLSASGVTKRQYVVQRYNLGLSNLEKNTMKSGKIVYTNKQMTPNDTINIKSLLMLPESIVKFSTIETPMTNILEKATLHQNYFMLFRLLRKKLEITSHKIDDLSSEFYNDRNKKEMDQSFMEGIHEFILDNELYVDEHEKFNKFLETIIPKTNYLIQYIGKYGKYGKNNTTFVDFVRQLEPYMVYPTDITYGQHDAIRYFIDNRIKTYKSRHEQRSKEMSVLRNTDYKVAQKLNPILRLLSEKHTVAETVFQTYNLLPHPSVGGPALPFGFAAFNSNDKNDTKLSSQEILLRMIQMDNGNLYTNILTSIMISLMTPNNLMNALAEPNLDDVTDLEKIKPTDCTRRYLSKKYETLAALQKDNNVDEIYYDKDMDDTPYDILKKYKDQQKEMLPDLFFEFLTETLIHKHDCPKNAAVDLTKTLIANKKQVQDGDYAILELKPKLPENIDESRLSDREKESIEIEADIRKKIQYYRRLKNNWVKDVDIEDESFLDTNTIFCNISANCYKNLVNNTCEAIDDTAARMKSIAKKKMLSEFDKRYTINVDELEGELEKNIEYYLKMLKKTHMLKELQINKANNLAFELGNLASTTELIISPYMKLRDLILGQDDFSKKQYDICRFVETYCRAPMVDELDEHKNWMYCKETNTKLFPSSIYELADVFISGGDYQRKQNELCHQVGLLSDDGDSIVDKHSGFVLRKIDFISEEGYDESGLKLTSNDILEKDIGIVVTETDVKKTERVFENPLTETIYNVFSSICSNIDIPIDSIDEFVLRTSNELIAKHVISTEKYQIQSDANLKKTGHPLKTTYVNYQNETTINIVACTILIAIQSATPSFQTKRTFPGCVRSFSGYPLNGIEDLTGIKYMACVLEKTKSPSAPWDAIKSFKTDALVARMKSMIEKHILLRSDINELFVKKREYILLHPELTAPEEHSISKWHHFLPPVVEFSIIKKITKVTNDFRDEFMELMRKGSSDQNASLNVFKSKIIQLGYGIIESINTIVKSKDTLLKTAARIPFLENACCNDKRNATNPLFYFNEEDNTISTYVHSAIKLAHILKQVRIISTAPILYHPDFTGIKYPIVPFGQLEENIYAAVIWYCNYDRNLPVPDEYIAISNECPPLYNPSWTIQEKMEFLKKNGKRYKLEDLIQLMTLVNRKNIVKTESKIPFTQVDVLKELIQKFDLKNSTIIAEPLRRHLTDVLDSYDPKKMTDSASEELDKLTNYLIDVNTDKKNKIVAFFDKHGNLDNNNYNKIFNFLSNIQKWELDRPMSETKSYFDEGLYTVVQYIQNAIHNFTKVYPTILLNNADFFKNVPKHWNLSDAHDNDIASFINKYYDNIEKFKGDPVLLLLLQGVNERLVDVNTFVQNIPVHTDVVKEIIDESTGEKTVQTFHSLFNKLTIYQLFLHCFYSSIYEYIVCCSETEYLRADVQTIKLNRRTVISNNANPSNSMKSALIDSNDDIAENDSLIQEADVFTGNPEELSKRVCSLMLTFLNVEQQNKDAIDFSYKQIIQRVNRSKEKEKQKITGDFYKLSPEERKIENDLKEFRLGRWNVGQQTGLIKYDQTTYDRERDELMKQIINDEATGTSDIVTGMMLDVYDLEQTEEDELNAQDDHEAFGIEDLGENYMDGEYYDEDNADDF